MQQEVIVMNVSKYDMVVNDTGENLKGTTVRYALTDSLTPYEEDNLKGYKLAKTSLPFEEFAKFPTVPGVYQVDLNYNINNDGTAKLVAKNFVFKFPVAMAAPQPKDK